MPRGTAGAARIVSGCSTVMGLCLYVKVLLSTSMFVGITGSCSAVSTVVCTVLIRYFVERCVREGIGEYNS
jgi:hypothetical protein